MNIAEQKTIYVGIYARVSSDLDSQKTSIPHQVQMLSELATIRGEREGQNWIVLPEYIYEDEDVSGRKVSIKERPAIKRMLADVQAKRISVVMFKGISRFSRDQQDGITLYNELTKLHNVRVISEEENFDSASGHDASFWFGFHTLMAQFESDKIGTRVAMGKRQSAKNGQFTGQQPPDGYLVDKETRKLIPDPERAPIIKRIFDTYVNQNLSYRQLAGILYNEGILTARGKEWTAQGVANILKHTVYLGQVELGGWRTETVIVDGVKKQKKFRNEADKIEIIENAHPAIVDKETFEKAQELINRKARNRSIAHAKAPLTGILKCAYCGKSLVKVGNYYKAGEYKKDTRTGNYYARRKDSDNRSYTCVTRHNSGRIACDLKIYRAHAMERILYLSLIDKLGSFIEHFEIGQSFEETKEDTSALSKRVKQIEANIKKVSNASAQMAVDRELYDVDQFRQIMLKFKADIQQLKEEKTFLEKQLEESSKHKKDHGRIQLEIEQSFEVEPDNQEQLRELFQMWFAQIVVDNEGNLEIVPTVRGLGIVDEGELVTV